MHRSTRRLIWLVAGLLLFLIASALLYQAGMTRLEGAHRTFWDSFEWAAETLSTTGYGADSHWRHPAMVVLVVIVQFAGVFLVFLIVPIFLVPFLEERFERRVPRIPPKMANHVIVYRYGPTVETLLQRLADHDVASIVVETDESAARAVLERGLPAGFSRAEEDALDVCRLPHARALVANGRDEENAALILRARQMGFRGEIFAFVEEPAHRKPMELAGATSAYTPRHIIAAALAAHASEGDGFVVAYELEHRARIDAHRRGAVSVEMASVPLPDHHRLERGLPERAAGQRARGRNADLAPLQAGDLFEPRQTRAD